MSKITVTTADCQRDEMTMGANTGLANRLIRKTVVIAVCIWSAVWANSYHFLTAMSRR